jgi:hypothetical protein
MGTAIVSLAVTSLGDFEVGTMSTNLSSPVGETFDPEAIGFGAGQLVQGSNNAFDGLNRLQLGEGEISLPRVNNGHLWLVR